MADYKDVLKEAWSISNEILTVDVTNFCSRISPEEVYLKLFETE